MYIVSVEHEGTTYLRHYDQISLMLLAAESPAPEWLTKQSLKVPHSWTVQGRIVMQRGGGSPYAAFFMCEGVDQGSISRLYAALRIQGA